MNRALPAPSPRRFGGLAVVAALHVAAGWALTNGLARKVVEVIKAPIETKIIEEVQPPPPPPERLPPPPKHVPPPPAFVPPPEVVVTPPPLPALTISTTPVAPPPAPVALAPAPAEPAPAAPAPAARPASIDVRNCDKPVYPPAAERTGATGTTRIRFAIDADGRIARADVERASGPTREHKLLDRVAVEALSKCRFKAGTDDSGRPVGAFAVVDYLWKLD